MKNSKGIIAILCAIVLIVSLAACAQQKGKTENVTEAVTDENGEVVTDKNGEVVTQELEAQMVVTDADGKTVTEVVTDKSGKPLTTVINNKYVNVTQAVTVGNGTQSTTAQKSTNAKKTKKKKTTSSASTTKNPNAPKAPANISSLKVSDETKSSLKLSWSKVDCTAYQISFSADGGETWEYLEKEYNKTSYNVKDLISDTVYLFRVRAYNKNDAGTTPSAWKTVKAKTKVNNEPRKIKISIELPIDGDIEDELVIMVGGKEVKKEIVELKGDIYTFTTKEEYKGEVEIYAALKDHGSDSVKTDKAECRLSLPLTRIPVLIDDED